MIRQTLTLIGMLAAQPLLAVESIGEKDEEMRADCRVEGASAGLTGKDLEAFIAQCMADLKGLELADPRR